MKYEPLPTRAWIAIGLAGGVLWALILILAIWAMQ